MKTLQVEAQNQVVRKLEEKERLLQTNLATVEKELVLRQQAKSSLLIDFVGLALSDHLQRTMCML